MESGLNSGDLLDEKYLIGTPLGHGGMGSVYRATHIGTKRTVAVKIIRPQFTSNEEFVLRFQREAEAAGQLRHPNVVDVTDFGLANTKTGRVAYLVMEYLDGCNLAEVLEEEKQLPLGWVVDILDQVCSAVEQAHRNGIIHRDLKPENLWLEPNRRGGYTVKVLDFGLAKLERPGAPGLTEESAAVAYNSATRAGDSNASGSGSAPSGNGSARVTTKAAEAETITLSVDEDPAATLIQMDPLNEATRIIQVHTQAIEPDPRSTLLQADTAQLPSAPKPTLAGTHTGELTRVGSVMGTPLYMSPEQCRGEQLDARSDIYSLGVIAYRMLSGETPFVGDTETLVHLHCDATPRPITDLSPKVPRRAANLIMTALAKDPGQRPQSASAFAAALRAYSEGTGSLLRQSFSLYSEHFPVFFKLALISYAPLTLYLLVQLITDKVFASDSVVFSAVMFFGGFLGGHLVGYSMISAATVPIVTQLSIAPLRPVSVKAALGSFRHSWRQFLAAVLCVGLMIFFSIILSILGAGLVVIWLRHYAAHLPHWFFSVLLVLLTIPGIAIGVRYLLFAPVIAAERTWVIRTLRRANRLRKTAPLTAIVIALIQIGLPVLIFAAFNKVSYNLQIGENNVGLSFDFTLSNNFNQLLNLIVAPLTAIMTALVYLKARYASGEDPEAGIQTSDHDGMMRSRWQAKMSTAKSARSIPGK